MEIEKCTQTIPGAWRGHGLGMDAQSMAIHGCERHGRALISPESRRRPPMIHRLGKTVALYWWRHISRDVTSTVQRII